MSRSADVPARRAGSRTVAGVPREVLRRLHAGEIETASLAEMLAMDLGSLLRSVDANASAADVTRVREGGIVGRLRAGGAVLFERHGRRGFARFASHPSDMVRSMACFMLTADAGLSLPQRLERVRSLADDAHSGVREWAWIAVRPAIAAELDRAVSLLTPWTNEPSPNLRRYASEITRPRGVWCAHIDALKQQPQIALPILEPMRADPTKYVQDSVANWLNDAGKSQPEWVRALCAAWKRQSEGKPTERIVRRAMRNL
ncbi:MAG: DNA alkylation repair protein [Phycisphaerales bacterium]